MLGGVVITSKENAEKMKEERVVLGTVMGNLESYYLLRSLRSFYVRIKKQSKNAKKLSNWLSKQSNFVEKVLNPSFPHHPSHSLWSSSYLEDSFVFRMEKNDLNLVLSRYSLPCFSIRFVDQRVAQIIPSLLHSIVNCTSLGGVETNIDWRMRS